MDKVLKEKVSQALGISPATLENWRRAHLIPEVSQSFSVKLNEDDKTFSDFIFQIKKNTQNRLNSRANRTSSHKKFTVYQGITDSARKKLLNSMIETGRNYSVETAVIAAAVRQLECCGLMIKDSRIEKDIQKYGNINEFHLYDDFQIPNENDDILGALYQSLQSIGQKSGGGSFYTPANALSGIKVSPEKSVYDPCCGSGNILLHVLTKNHPSNLIFASDIDKLALLICEVNLVLFYNDANMQANLFIKSLILPEVLSDDSNENQLPEFPCVDYIITNPPWGAHFSATEKTELKKIYPQLQTAESFSICLYNSFKFLKPQGQLYFFLPEAFLNVAAHAKIRSFVLNESGCLEFFSLGAVFKGVFSKTILLHFERGVEKNKNLVVNEPYDIISVNTGTEDRILIEKLYSFPHITLKNNAKFFLGVVTGNNKNFLSTSRQKFSNAQPVFRGKNVRPYVLVPSAPKEYINFIPDLFQQCAAPQLYHQKKIVYRFISDHPVCAICDTDAIPLNSANCFIPAFSYPWETIVALFNSTLYAKVYKLKFNCVKILRTHLEALPLPLFTPEQHAQIKTLYDKIKSAPENGALLNEMNVLIESFFSLSNTMQMDN